ncbi:hypothetical protein RND81_13G165100 [Saponaria officinalis]|uniref:Pentatricopeptide repeat-containing protein n=1 Tax=Saponaria officinalis TaxID=3572 RepID=A0AAW1H6I4_SAPOF
MCNILVEQCSKAEEAWAIIHILHYMKENSLVLRYPIYLQAHETLKIAGEDDSLLRQVNLHISIDESVTLETEDKPHLSDVNSDIDMGLLLIFLRKKNFAAVDCLFAGILSRNKSLPSEIIEANCDRGRIDAALLAFEYSKNMSIEIDNVAYLSLIGVLIRANEFSKIPQVVEQMVSFNLFLEPAFAASLIYRLGQVRELDIAASIFNLLPEDNKSTSTYTALIDACFSAGYPGKGVETFQAMKRKKIQSALATYTILIRGLEMCGRDDEARFYRREKRSLETKHFVSDNVLMEVNVCDTLFFRVHGVMKHQHISQMVEFLSDNESGNMLSGHMNGLATVFPCFLTGNTIILYIDIIKSKSKKKNSFVNIKTTVPFFSIDFISTF